MVESVRWRRLRWRLRGAWQWPTFAALTAIDALLVARLPFQGTGGDVVGAILLAGFLNLLRGGGRRAISRDGAAATAAKTCRR